MAESRRISSFWRSVTVVLCGSPLAVLTALAGASPASAAVTSRGPATIISYPSTSTTTISVTTPAGTTAGDLVLATIGIGATGATTQTVITPPAGWTLVNRTNHTTTDGLAVYRHAFASGESSYTFTTNLPVGGVAVLSSWAGVDLANPVDVVAGLDSRPTTGAVVAPSVTTTTANTVLVANYFGYRGGAVGTTWTAPSGMTRVGTVSNGGSRSGSVHFGNQAAAGSTGTKLATASTTQDFADGILVALRAAPAVTNPPLISVIAASAITPSDATISWTTDQASDTQVEYGPTTAYGSSTVLLPSLVTAHVQGLAGLLASTTYHYRVKSRNAGGQLGTSTDRTFATTAQPVGPVPVIVDTDLFGDADDVGTLATAFGLQLKGEAQVVAIGVNTSSERPTVSSASWKCAAAVAQWYGFGNVPIGTDLPNDGTAVNNVEFATPCAAKALSPPATPLSAVRVFRQALANQPNGSVVMVEVGYQENLAALLSSPADSISVLTGRALVAQKVKALVVMGGGYPSRAGESNFAGNAAAAQTVASTWPTKVVYSGFEVGDIVFTGQTISATHPATSPVRAAYEAFAGPNNYIPSYDLTAMYHAVRPTDSKLVQVGPGTNSIEVPSGANTFSTGAGNQFYLTMPNASAVAAAIEALLGTLPISTGPNDSFTSNSLDPARWTPLPNGSTIAAVNQEVQITHPAGPWTDAILKTALPFNEVGRSVQVHVLRPANNAVGGAEFGETILRLRADATCEVQFFIAAGSLSAWVNNGTGLSNLTPSYPPYNTNVMQWLRFREAAGTLYWEYASGATAPGAWTTFFSQPNPIPLTAVTLEIEAGSNVGTTDTARFDNISTI
jgi:inosine-uridine nucleoside N-ribohydrolase